MKILYLANIRFPTEKAHGIQIAKTCEAFAALGHSVELVVTDRKTDVSAEPYEYFGVAKSFKITRLPTWDTVDWGAIGFLLESIVFAFRARSYTAQPSADVVYGRDEVVLAFAHGRIIWESHTGAWNWFARRVARREERIVAISEGLRAFYMSKGVRGEKTVVAHDGIDLKDFENPPTSEIARARLGLPLEKKIAMYVGRVDGWKGTETLFEAAKLLTDWLVVIIGGEPAQVEDLAKRYPGVRFLGYRPYTELSKNLAAADVLVLPNTAKDVISQQYTSPLKLFAYMAAGKPIVASDLPSIREILDDSLAILVTPDDPMAIAQGVGEAYGDSARASRARERVSAYSWGARAKAIIGDTA